MRRLLSVNIDVNRVRANLSRECGQVASAADVLRLLIRCGCYRWGDRWVAASPLDMLRPNEVIDTLEATAEAVELVRTIERGALLLEDRCGRAVAGGCIMHDSVSIWHNDKSFRGWRYLWEDDVGAVFQTTFYQHRHRPDPTAYCRFAVYDAAMNVVAERLLAELVDETAEGRRPG